MRKERNDSLSRMTLVEKVGQMCQYVGIEHVKKSEKYLSIEEMQSRMHMVFILIFILQKCHRDDPAEER